MPDTLLGAGDINMALLEPSSQETSETVTSYYLLMLQFENQNFLKGGRSRVCTLSFLWPSMRVNRFWLL